MTVQGEGKRWEELVSNFFKGRALGRRFRKVFFSENSPVIYLFRTPSSRIHFHFMASGDGASLSPVRHSLLHLLRSSSKPFLADRNPLISSPPPMARKKEGRFASVAPRRRRRRRTRQPRRPRGLIRTGSVTGRGGRRSGRRRGGVVMAATSGARLVFHLPPRRRWTVLYRTVGWRGAGGGMPPTGLIQRW